MLNTAKYSLSNSVGILPLSRISIFLFHIGAKSPRLQSKNIELAIFMPDQPQISHCPSVRLNEGFRGPVSSQPLRLHPADEKGTSPWVECLVSPIHKQ
jgi:hypothetical protein